MRIKLPILLLLCVSCCLMAHAQRVLSAKSRLQLAQTQSKFSAIGENQSFDAFIEVGDDFTVAQLKELGIQVYMRVGNILTARIPLNALPRLGNQCDVHRVTMAQPMSLCNDTARYLCRVDAAHEGISLPATYTGKGIIVGMIDVGIDFNHINLCDSNGVSRVAGAYMPADTTGISPVIDGTTLPGSAYETPEEIAQLTTDCTTLSHGTHTTGTAAGSYRGKPFYGVAPEATLVLCSMPEDALTDVNIANSLNYIFDYANRAGMPAVVNMSISSHDGAHDGSSMLCRLMDALSGKGRICVLAAGNDGTSYLHAQSPWVSLGDTVTAILTNSKHDSNVSGYVSVWATNDVPHDLRFVLMDRTTSEIVKWSPLYEYSELVADSVFHVELGAAFGEDYGDDCVDFAFERLHKFHSVFNVKTGHLPDSLLLGLQFAPHDSCELMSWSSGLRMHSFRPDDPLWMHGCSEMSISDLATGDSTISVGAFYSRAQAAVLSGNNSTLTSGVRLYEVVNFSSYGPDAKGVMRPDVIAPGMSLVSSYNRYYTQQNENPRWVNSYVTIGDERYAFGLDFGTSMASPVVAGAVALWLEANPELCPSDVREVLKKTCYRDRYLADADVRKYGFGKLDATAGLRYVLTGAVQGDVNADGRVNVSDVTALINSILGITEGDAMKDDVNGDGRVNVSDVAALVNIILGL